MRRAAGAGGARPGQPLGGALRPDPAARSRPAPAQTPSRGRGRGRGRRLADDPQAASASPDLAPAPDVFSVWVRLEETGEMFRVANCYGDMTVRELKEELDLMVAIPFDLQRLHYLDQGVLLDDTTLKFQDLVPDGIISLCIWHYDGWTELILAAIDGDPSKLSCLGITEDSFYRTAHSKHFEGEQWKQWTSQRAFVALYICSHRGHTEAVRYLLAQGTNCVSKSPVGRTPLHVAAAMGRLDCISLLMKHGFSIHDRDNKGETALTVARRLNRKKCEKRMFLLHCMARSGAKDPRTLHMKDILRRATTSGFESNNSWH